MSIRVGDWVNLNCGDIVHAADDPRHLGRVEFIHGTVIKVRWLDNRWFSHLERAELVVVERANSRRREFCK
jgi:hypothetical protein